MSGDFELPESVVALGATKDLLRVSILERNPGADTTARPLKRPSPEETEEERRKREDKRKRNRTAARKCRQKKEERAQELEQEVDHLEGERAEWLKDIANLQEMEQKLKEVLASHQMVCTMGVTQAPKLDTPTDQNEKLTIRQIYDYHLDAASDETEDTHNQNDDPNEQSAELIILNTQNMDELHTPVVESREFISL